MNSCFGIHPVRMATWVLAAGTLAASAGCTSSGSLLSGEKVDYRSQSVKTSTLDVPPDLTQIARDSRYQPQAGVITASSMANGNAGSTPVAANTAAVAPLAVGPVQMMRDGQTRWLSTQLAPEAVFPMLRQFWMDQGFVLDVDNPLSGVLETDWAENRAKLPQDTIRKAIGQVFDSLYSTGERDRFRTRVERTPAGGTEIYLTHRGLEEVFDSELKERTVWQPRPRDPQLEAEFLSRLMVRMGAPKAEATAALAATPVTMPAAPGRPVSAADLPDQAQMRLAQPFDRAWRVVGLALDSNGFTVEDRDRSAGQYFVRYVDLKQGQKEQGFFDRLFGNDAAVRPTRYRVQLKPDGETTLVTVLNSAGVPDNGEAARRIIARLSQSTQGL